MSDALNYLVRVRGDALGHYFKFLKEAGRHLDPKTRSLISVITKVHAQTETGLRQYLLQALRVGCSPMEVLDALLMAFPALGLTKIVWATEIILDLDIPGFSPELMASPPQWRDVMAEADIAEGETQRVETPTRSVFVYREGDRFKVYDTHCPHQLTDMPCEAVRGKTLTCPTHQWTFDVSTGACIENGKYPLTAFDTRVEEGRLLAYW
ncbi:MAG TPA: Rieske 2Fe-2S domain-containing protein [Thiobacillaceae bacterium]|nr:Rieske 2Fe-2S domain-containing protein [Thiobacillaceae bacterium]HNU63069.1 Rieske 2Fe-2S domain-containing protein [Thiobacillaceae bacterium]